MATILYCLWPCGSELVPKAMFCFLLLLVSNRVSLFFLVCFHCREFVSFPIICHCLPYSCSPLQLILTSFIPQMTHALIINILCCYRHYFFFLSLSLSFFLTFLSFFFFFFTLYTLLFSFVCLSKCCCSCIYVWLTKSTQASSVCLFISLIPVMSYFTISLLPPVCPLSHSCQLCMSPNSTLVSSDCLLPHSCQFYLSISWLTPVSSVCPLTSLLLVLSVHLPHSCQLCLSTYLTPASSVYTPILFLPTKFVCPHLLISSVCPSAHLCV